MTELAKSRGIRLCLGRSIRLILTFDVVTFTLVASTSVGITTATQSAAQETGIIAGAVAATRDARMLDLQSQAVAAPGYSNGNYAYLDSFGAVSNASPMVPGSCTTTPFTLTSFSPSTNFGYSYLRVTLTADTFCGSTPYTTTWTFGDLNSSIQTAANISGSIDGRAYADFIYNHTYTYIGSFVPQVSITDGASVKVSGSVPIYVSFAPSLFYSFYNESGLIGQGLTGSKYSIGLAEECDKNINNETNVYKVDLRTFDTTFSLTNPTLNFFYSGGSSCTSTGSIWSPLETELDIEWAHVAAPGAKIYVCLDTLDTYAGLQGCDTTFYNNRNSSADNTMIVSNSFGECAVSGPYLTTPSCTNAVDPYAATWSSAKSAGMNLLASTGDWLPNSICDLANYPASNPYGVAVGGTTITSVSPTGSYGSETPWVSTTTGQQCTYKVGGNQVGSNGKEGETYGTNSYYSAPSWQTTLLSNSNRYFPDVSMIGNQSVGVPIISQGVWYIVGGTSVGSPVWAGILDMLFQAGAPGLSGFAAPFLYSYPACFHEVMNPAGARDGLGTPNVGCLAAA